MPAERLQKIIAAAGITSRRKAEELITQGRVTVNGQVITELGSKADPGRDHIKVDGKLLRGAEQHIYLLLYKPKGYVTTLSDPEGRPTVMDLVKHVGERIYPVGRLDYGSEGLLLMTNDGELANFLTRAASHVPKTYLVKISGQAAEEDIEKLRHGIRIGSKPGPRGMQAAVRTAPAQVRIVREANNPWYEVTLIEGKNRQIRRMFEEIGHHVEKIKRVRYGPLSLDVEPGQFRELTAQEVAALRKPQREPVRPQRSAARAASRFLGKAREKRREQEPFRRRGAGPQSGERAPGSPKPGFTRAARQEEPEAESSPQRHARRKGMSGNQQKGQRVEHAGQQQERFPRSKKDHRTKASRPRFGRR
ncbi:MAG: pseudouridine synthase [Actinomycetota bacterium]